MNATNMLANTIDLVNQARALGVQILHAPIAFAAGFLTN